MIAPNTSVGKADIFIVDNLPPEAVAMAQALYSRSPKSVAIHLDKIAASGHEAFMGTYYVGYGHKSIGDCGSTTLFIENVSMLAAKAIQDWKLYRGQEASTRYLDMSKQEVLNPLGTAAGALIQQRWMDFYVRVLGIMQAEFRGRHPYEEGQDQQAYDKAIKAKAFDVARGFLPAGATTYVSWSTDLRQAADHLANLRHHPLEEVRELAGGITASLKEKYPSSFSHKLYPEQEEYRESHAGHYYDRELNAQEQGFKQFGDVDLLRLLCVHGWDVLEKRPARTELPAKLEKYGLINYQFPLDFGSFRDIQRHRNGVCEMPRLTTRHGFFQWYLDQLPTELLMDANLLIARQTAAIEALPTSDLYKQYYTAMGFTVACDVTYSIPQSVYVAELRAGQTVHPTLRKVAQQIGQVLRQNLPRMALYVDDGPEIWSVKRGTQDIVAKEPAAI